MFTANAMTGEKEKYLKNKTKKLDFTLLVCYSLRTNASTKTKMQKNQKKA